MSQTIPMIGALLCLVHLFHSTQGTGYLLEPQPRSFGDVANRAELINQRPCGGKQFNAMKPINQIPASNRILTGNITGYTFRWKLIYLQAQQSQVSYFICLDNQYARCHQVGSTIAVPQTNTIQTKVDHVTIPQGFLFPGESVPATLVWQWKISQWEYITNCADILLIENSHTTKPTLTLSDFPMAIIPPFPHPPCVQTPANFARRVWHHATIGESCSAPNTQCPLTMCCSLENNKIPGFCGPYPTQTGDYMSPGFGPIDYFRASVPFCNGTRYIDNRYVPNSLYTAPADQAALKDLCYKCSLPNPGSCSYDFYQNVTTVPTLPPVGKKNGSTSPASNPVIILLAILVAISFCILLVCLYRFHQFNVGSASNIQENLLPSETVGGSETKKTSMLARATKKLKPTSLPTGWKEYFTDDNEPYYYNEETGETQWEKPAA